MQARPAALPPLLDNDSALERYLGDPQHNAYAATPGVDMATWLASGEDAEETRYQQARRLGLPLVRLQSIAADPATAALLKPELARRLRIVPLRSRNGRLAAAMEDPTNADAIAALEFLSTDRVLPLVATPRGIREAIARNYDQVEDRETVRQLGLDPVAVLEGNESEALRLSREQPIVRMVHTMIANAVARRASDIHLRPGEHATDVLYRIDDELVPVRSLLRALHPAVVSRIKVLGSMTWPNTASRRMGAPASRWTAASTWTCASR